MWVPGIKARLSRLLARPLNYRVTLPAPNNLVYKEKTYTFQVFESAPVSEVSMLSKGN